MEKENENAMYLALDCLETIARDGIDENTFNDGGDGYAAVKALKEALGLNPTVEKLITELARHAVEPNKCPTHGEYYSMVVNGPCPLCK